MGSLLTFLTKAGAFIVKDFFEAVSYKVYFLFTLWNVLFAVLVFFFLSRVMPEDTGRALEQYGGGYFPFVLVGFALVHYLDLAMHGMGSKIREAQIVGTLEALLVTRTPPWQILLFSILYQFLYTSIVVLTYLLIGWAFFGLDLSHAAWGTGLLMFLLTAASLAPFGILSAAVVLIIKRGEPMAYVVAGLSYLLSGVFYPVEVLPAFLQTAAQFFPLTHALDGMRRALLMGTSAWEMPYRLGVLLVFSIVLLPMSLWLFSRVLKHARKTGGLHHY